MRVTDIDPTVTPEIWAQRMDELTRVGAVHGEGFHCRSDGTTYPIEFSSRLVQLDRDYVVTVVRDVTERRKSQERIREQAMLLNQASDAILLSDVNQVLRYWNQGAERAYGWTSAEVIGKKLSDILPSEPAVMKAAMEELLRTAQWSGVLRQQRKDGSEVFMQSRWTLLRDLVGSPRSILSINSDITSQRKLEAQFLRTQRLESIGTLAGGIAHDFNNILAPILMGISLLRAIGLDEEDRETLDMLESSAKRGRDLVRQVLGFSRGIEGERLTIQPLHIIKEIAQIVRDTFPKSISLTVKCAGEIWPIIGDPTQLHQVLMNLCVNARDAMPQGGALTLALANVQIDETFAGMNPTSSPGPYVVIKVSDNGTGIPAAVLERMFEPFFTTKEVGKGTGLGLSTVVAIMKSHGGFVHVYSEPARGTSFKVYFPASREFCAALEPAPPPAEVIPGSGEVILVVDDELAIRTVAQRTLVARGYEVLLARNGAEGVSVYALNRDRIAVVLTDVAMPIMDGVAMIVALRSINPEVMVIGSSGINATTGVTQAAAMGANHFLPKPYLAEDLFSVLQKALRERKSTSNPD